MIYGLLLLGFVFLVVGADWFVAGSSAIATHFKIPAVIIGLTIVALGTSAPEIAVSVSASLKGNGDIAISNVIGSNIFNLFVVLGACGTIKAFPIDQNILKRDYVVCIGTTVTMLLFIFNRTLSRVEGFILLGLMVLYLFFLLREALRFRDQLPVAEETQNLPLSILKMLIGVGGIIVGGEFVVDSASAIATNFGLSQTFIGLTIVAMGTSLPELVTSVMAARKGESELAIGNVIGSNIFNFLLITGIASSIVPLQIAVLSIYDCLFFLVGLVFLYSIMKERETFSAKIGIPLILCYFGYMGYIVLR